MKVYILTGVLFLLLFSTAFAHDGGNSGFIIHIQDNGFEPTTVRIRQGDTVIFENVGNKDYWPASNIHPTHRAYPNSGIEKCGIEDESVIFDACRPLPPGSSYSFIFANEGTWQFHDHLHSQFSGKIIVEEGEENRTENITPASDTKPKGFFSKIYSYVKNLFANLFNFVFLRNAEVKEEKVEVEEEKPVDLVFENQEEAFSEKQEFDVTITKGANNIFNDYDALFSYIKQFGPTQTLYRLQELESTYGSCHDTAHYLGRFAYEIHSKDAFRLCDTGCQSGCYHGAVEEFFRRNGTKNLAENLNSLCTSDLNSFITHQCFHGMGHGLMAWSSYEIFEALDSCDLIKGERDRESCYGGIFMENIVQSMAEFLGLEGHTSKYLSDDPHFPCSIVDEKYKAMCYFLQTDRVVQLFNGDLAKIASVCSEAPPLYQRYCFQSMGRDVSAAYDKDPAGAIIGCANVPPGPSRVDCLVGAVQDTFWDPSGQDRALRFCRLLNDKTEKDACYNDIFDRAPGVLTAKEDLKAFCQKAESQYQKKCFSTLRITTPFNLFGEIIDLLP